MITIDKMRDLHDEAVRLYDKARKSEEARTEYIVLRTNRYSVKVATKALDSGCIRFMVEVKNQIGRQIISEVPVENLVKGCELVYETYFRPSLQDFVNCLSRN